MGVWTDTTGATPAQQHSTITQFLETFGKALHQRESDQNFRKSKTQHFRSRFHCRRSPGFETLVRFIFCQREVGWERQRLVWHFPSPSDCSSSHIGTKEGTFSLVTICLRNLGQVFRRCIYVYCQKWCEVHAPTGRDGETAPTPLVPRGESPPTPAQFCLPSSLLPCPCLIPLLLFCHHPWYLY